MLSRGMRLIRAVPRVLFARVQIAGNLLLGRIELMAIRKRPPTLLDRNGYRAVHVVVAHPDDELLAVGSLLQCWAQTLPITVYYADSEPDPLRYAEAENLAAKLGFGLKVGAPSLLEPDDLVMTFAPWDGHPEHRRAGVAGMKAAADAGCRQVALFGIFTPLTPILSNAGVVGSANKLKLFDTYFSSQRHIRRAVRELAAWERMQGGRDHKSAEMYMLVDIVEGGARIPTVPVAEYPRANFECCRAYTKRYRRLRERTAQGSRLVWQA